MLLDFMEIPQSKSNMYMYIYSEIKNAVFGGIIKSGERLPSIRQASKELKVSRTTVENAYLRLCIEGIAESEPQRGYYICDIAHTFEKKKEVKEEKYIPEYDFSSQKIDPVSADTSLWCKNIRAALTDSRSLISYGDAQGEYELRAALSEYAFKARGVKAKPENIIIGAGVGTLLNILCGLTGTKIKAGIENSGFKQAEMIFSDYGIPCEILKSDSSGAKPQEIGEDINVLFLLPSSLSKISVSAITARRNAFSRWVNEGENRLIIEDDYNGELRYTARALGAFQGKTPEKTVYIGSFSKLLLPSVRIAYMVLPDFLALKFKERCKYHNQTCGKTEQTALCNYIKSGALEKHLRRLRKLYNSKSKIMLEEIKKRRDVFKSCTLFESSLTVEVETVLGEDSEKICKYALNKGVSVSPAKKRGCIRLSFAGIETENIVSGIERLYNILKNYVEITVGL